MTTTDRPDGFDPRRPDPAAVERFASAREAVLQRVVAAAESAGRDPGSIEVVAVSKTHPVESIAAAHAAGFDVFGESYAAEFASKAAALADLEIEWHFIGQLQTNKAKLVVPAAQVVESVDRSSLIEAVARRAPGSTVYLQVNLSGESHRGGVDPAEVADLHRRAVAAGLVVDGLMGVAPLADEASTRASFRQLRRLCDDEGVAQCSMGMSGDLELAVSEGSTIVRVGTAIFGERPAPR